MAKRRSDPDYLENQNQAQKAWASRNSGYWKQYRTEHPDYAAANRDQQRHRNDRRKASAVAKMDFSNKDTLESALYELRRIDGPPLAKMDAWIVSITVISHAAGTTTAAP